MAVELIAEISVSLMAALVLRLKTSKQKSTLKYNPPVVSVADSIAD